MNTRHTALGCFILLSFGGLLGACEKTDKSKTEAHHQSSSTQEPAALDYIAHNETYNAEAPIPPQCYTKTEGKHNPCYVCHQSYQDNARTNMMNDGFQQGSYAFSDAGLKNSWSNLFKDRRQAIAAVSDKEIIDYVNQDNYGPLIKWMKSEAWQGVVPEIKQLASGADAFASNGLARDGSRWVAFNYKPLPSTFWPTNGSTDDTMIRLAAPFTERNGVFSENTYYANLSAVELAISGLDHITTPPLDEIQLNRDINNDGQLNQNVTLMFAQQRYFGDAENIDVAHMLYPQNTEFLHTVRYLGVDHNGEIYPAQRMKEVRYMVKRAFKPKAELASRYYSEFKEKHFENLPNAVNKYQQGISNGFGWLLLGFIEDENGRLRKQHHEEQFACVGCHKSIGTTIDQTFAFPRKVAGAEGWGYINLKTITDVANIGEANDATKQNAPQGEYLTYMQRVQGGDEFRQNTEMLARWFNPNGEVNKEKVRSLTSIYPLITPSAERALALNKAYREVVKEQSYLFGRDAVLSPASNVLQAIDTDIAPLQEQHRYRWDIRLNWQQTESTLTQTDY